MFSVEERELVRDRVLQMASGDTRIVAGAVIGSLAFNEGDRWSDLDLTFGVRDGIPIVEILENWTHSLRSEFGAAKLFDLPSGTSLYRVFLLPGCLQFDLSFTPASDFGATGPKFKLLFGNAVEKPHFQPSSAEYLFGYAVHHALRARFCIERGRYWQAEYWISAVRDNALSLACRRRNLSTTYGRGFDDLPLEVLEQSKKALVCTLDRSELLRALENAVSSLLREAEEIKEFAQEVAPHLGELSAP